MTGLLPVLAAVFAGALTQRITGLGFALVAAPLLVIIAGPYQGVLLANLLSVVVAGAVLAQTFRNVDRRRALVLAVSGVTGVVPGALAARLLPPGPLTVAVGTLVLAGLLAALAGRRLPAPPTAAAGFASGFMNASAGVGGPALVVYATATGWSQAAFVASAQLSFLVQSALSLGLKGFPELPGWQLAAVVSTLAAGLAGGRLLAPRISATHARRAGMALGFAGALITVVKGMLTW
ncbi:TSUP family transporter [Nonomuraea sp. NPDC049480]|uniref:TSUP family transporter n=1 Tax=Nonomuraea sp. NPDC049480 TaxID=3364353 RepID=UPI00379857CB